jgi:hypothetical protein
MVLVLLFVMFALFIVAPSTLIFATVQGIRALVAKMRGRDAGAVFNSATRKALGIGVAITLLAVLMLGACGKDLVVK